MKTRYGDIRKKTFLLLLILTVSIIFVAFLSYLKLYAIKESFDILYEKRIFPVIKLEEINSIYSLQILRTIEEMKKGNITPLEAEESVSSAKESIDIYWKECKKALSKLKENEGFEKFLLDNLKCSFEGESNLQYNLISDIELKKKEIFKTLTQVFLLYEDGNIQEGEKLLKKVNRLIGSMHSSFSQLINYNLECISVLKERIYKFYKSSGMWMLFFTIFIVFISIWFSVRIMKHIECIAKRAEEVALEKDRELQNLKRELEEKIKREVKKSRDKDQIMFQQARLAAMGEMIGNIAHQWRQPLNALTILIQSFATKQMVGGLTPEFVEKQVEKGMAIANSMSKTLDDFRNFFKPNRKKELFSIKKAIEDAYNFVKPICDKEGIEVKIECIKDIQIMGYQNEFTQVILNLFTNARDNFVEKKIVDRKIAIKIERKITPMPIAFIIFTDTGGGVDEKIIDKIFDPYFTTKHQSAGTGIGLYMSKQIIEMQMEGKIIVKNVTKRFDNNNLYRGAQFIIAIPIK